MNNLFKGGWHRAEIPALYGSLGLVFVLFVSLAFIGEQQQKFNQEISMYSYSNHASFWRAPKVLGETVNIAGGYSEKISAVPIRYNDNGSWDVKVSFSTPLRSPGSIYRENVENNSYSNKTMVRYSVRGDFYYVDQGVSAGNTYRYSLMSRTYGAGSVTDQVYVELPALFSEIPTKLPQANNSFKKNQESNSTSTSGLKSSPEIVFWRDGDVPKNNFEGKNATAYYPGAEIQINPKTVGMNVIKLTLSDQQGSLIPTSSIKTKKIETSGNRLTIPNHLSSGAYTLTAYFLDKSATTYTLIIRDGGPKSEYAPENAQILPQAQVLTRSIACRSCQWEMSFAVNPINPNEMAVAAIHAYFLSTDGGKTWSEKIFESIAPLPKGQDSQYYIGDTVVTFDKNGVLYVGVMYIALQSKHTGQRGTPGIYGGIILKGKINQNPEIIYYNDHSYVASGAEQFLIDGYNAFNVDYEKIAVSNNGQHIFTTGNLSLPSTTPGSPGRTASHKGIRYSQDYGKTWKNIHNDAYTGSAPVFIDLDLENKPYFITHYGEVYKIDPLTNDGVKKLAAPSEITNKTFPHKRLHYGTDKYLTIVPSGYQILVDKSHASKYKGRVYLIYSNPESVIAGSVDGPMYFGENYNIYVAYSDNGGTSWSKPTKVSDDNNKTDQVVPHAILDGAGNIHISFIDQREHPNEGKFDYVYSASYDGGVTFSPNVKVSEKPFTVVNGGRAIGDYLHTTGVSGGRVFIAHPCDTPGIPYPYEPNAVCFAEIATTQTTSYKPDINNDGNIDYRDYTTLGNIVNSSISCPAGNTCDVNGDGKVSLADWSAFNLYLYTLYDLTKDNKITQADSDLMTKVVSGTSVCPVASCDFTKDGSITMEDLNKFKTIATTFPSYPGITKPTINPSGVVNSADYGLKMAKDSIATLYGSNLTNNCTQSATSVPVSTILCNTQVKINGLATQLIYVSPTQINFYIPQVSSSVPSLVVENTTNGSSELIYLLLDSFGLGIFSANQKGTGVGSIQEYPTYRNVTESTPTSPGKIVIIYATGGGETKPDMYIGNTKIPAENIQYFGKNSFLGQKQINVLLPQNLNLPAGTSLQNVKFCQAGSTANCSNTVTMPMTSNPNGLFAPENSFPGSATSTPTSTPTTITYPTSTPTSTVPSTRGRTPVYDTANQKFAFSKQPTMYCSVTGFCEILTAWTSLAGATRFEFRMREQNTPGGYMVEMGAHDTSVVCHTTNGTGGKDCNVNLSLFSFIRNGTYILEIKEMGTRTSIYSNTFTIQR